MGHRPLVVTISPRAVMTITPKSAPEAEHGTESEYNDGPPDSDSGPRSKRSYFYNVHRIQRRELQM